VTFAQKVRLMPILAGVSFLLVLLINEVTGARNAKLMSTIEAGQLPAAELSRDVATSLVEGQQALHDAVAASNERGLDEADAVRERIMAALRRGRSNPAFPPGEVLGFEDEFARYYTLAREVSARLIAGERGESLQPRMVEMAAKYTSLRDRLQGFVTNQGDQVRAAFVQARENHARSVRLLTLVLSLALISLVLVSGQVIRSTLASLRAATAAVAASKYASRRITRGSESPDEMVRLIDSLHSTLAALEQSEQRLNEAQRLAQVGSWGWDEAGRSTWSAELCRILGRTDLLSASTGECIPPSRISESMELVHPDDRSAVKAAIEAAYSDKGPFRLDLRIVRPDGEVRSLVAHGEVLEVGGTVVGLRAAIQDVTDSEVGQRALRESEDRYRALFEKNPQPMWVYDLESLRFLAVNNAALAHYGYSRDEFLLMSILDIQPEEDVEAARLSAAQAPSGLERSGVWRHRRKDGSLLDVEMSSHGTRFGARPGRLVLANDVSDRRRLEEQLRQAQKMDAIGRLAGGVAHDFNNILGVILGYGEMVRRGLPVTDPLQPKITAILRAADRAADLTRQLLTFSRKQVVQPRILDLNIVVNDMEKMLRRLIGEDVTLKTLPCPDLGSVEADAGQMEQVVMNLAVNARDAMPDGGTLLIETQNVELDSSHVKVHPESRVGPHIMLAVSDTGLGMDRAIAAQIFEPFFTTKGVGKGTGLGLSTVYGIVTAAGGDINVYSEVGHGTTFKVYLPRVALKADVAATVVRAPPPRGTETVLLVEDEAALREMVRDVLEQAGYRVIPTVGPRDAIVAAEGRTGAIHIVLTDVIMPEMNGRDLVRKLVPLIGEPNVVYMSGYTDDAIGHHGLLDQGMHFLQKPFTSEQLLLKLREALDCSGVVLA
jgi:two-component system, cell cycle sensor histidine kinase and response regulator CckA